MSRQNSNGVLQTTITTWHIYRQLLFHFRLFCLHFESGGGIESEMQTQGSFVLGGGGDHFIAALCKGCLPSLGLQQLLLLIFLTSASVMTLATMWNHQILVPMKEVFEYNKVSRGHAPFLPLYPVQHLPKRVEKKRNCKICYEKQRHKAERMSSALLAMFTFSFCWRMTASLSGTAIRAARWMSLQKSRKWCTGSMYILNDS